MTKVLIAHGNTQRLKKAVGDLQARGFDVAATPDGGDAFARFFEEDPDIVVCSAALPGLSGLNFGRMVRSQAPHTPVVIVIEGEPTDEMKGLDVVPEPLDAEALCVRFPELAPAKPEPSEAPSPPPPTPTEVFTLSALKRFQRGSNLLSLLDDRGVARMARMAEQRRCGDGELIVRQGDPGDSFYLVVEGQVRVTLREQEDAEVARISDGGFFGEMSLLSDQPRQASVWSVGATTLLRFGRDEFLPLLTDYPSLRELLSGVAIERSEENLWSVLLADDEVQRTLGTLGEAKEVPAHPAPGAADARPPAAPDRASAQFRDADTGEIPKPTIVPAPIAASATAGAADIDLLEAAVQDLRAAERDADTLPHGRALEPAAAGRAGASGGASGPGLRAGALAAVRGGMASAWRTLATAPRGVLIFIAAIAFGAGVLITGILVAVVGGGGEPASTAATAMTEVAPAPKVAADRASEPPGAREADAAEASPATTPASRQPAAKAATNDPSRQPSREAATDAKLPETERRELRKQLFALFRSKSYAAAAEVGRKLRPAVGNDWEAELLIADAERNAGQLEPALAGYQGFIEKYPTNYHLDEAQFWAADILLGMGKKAEAKPLLQKVLAKPRSAYRSAAEARLKKL